MSGQTGQVPSASNAPSTNASPGSEPTTNIDFAGPRSSSSINNINAITANASPRRTGSSFMSNLSIKKIFGHSSAQREKENARKLAALISNDGSIRQGTWDGLSPGSEKRIETLQQLHEVVKNRSLQVSTLEGLYHDTKDMLSDPDTKDPALRLIIELTEAQRKQLGLALRHTFFDAIKTIGVEELTVKWLNALSNKGEDVNGFEKDMDYLMAEWVEKTLAEYDHPQAINVLQLAQQFIRHNSAFICRDSINTLLKCICERGCKRNDSLTQECLKSIDCIMIFSELPSDKLYNVVAVLCIQVCDDTFRRQAWSLTRKLLNSHLGHRARSHLQNILQDSEMLKKDTNSDFIKVVRGAVFCLTDAIWGTHKIDMFVWSPAAAIPYFEKAMAADVNVCIDVLTALRRLIQRNGRDLQQMTWAALIHLFETLLALCDERPEYQEKCKAVHDLLLLTEQLYRDGLLNASPDLLFDLIERCANHRPNSSIIALIEYRAENISPSTPDWIEHFIKFVKTYSHESQAKERRSKVLYAMHSIYTRFKLLYEPEIVTQVILPLSEKVHQEKDSRIQYQMINILLDVAKTVSIRDDCKLFESVISLIRKLFNNTMKSSTPADELDFMEHSEPVISENGITMDNLCVLSTLIDEVLVERWMSLSPKLLNILIDTLVEHIEMQYSIGWNNELGCDIRISVLTTLLSIHCCPITNRIQRFGRDDNEPQTNVFIQRKHSGFENGFTWSKICTIVTRVLDHDTSWNVIQECLEKLGRVLEHIELVLTATPQEVELLTQTLVSLYKRNEEKKTSFPVEPLSKYLPPVLATLINYTMTQENKSQEVCRVLTDCVKYEQVEAVMACDIAIQLVPERMSSNAHTLIEELLKLKPTSKRAIPVIELLSDSADIPEFQQLFKADYYKKIVDILVPYADAREFSTYIVACIHRVLMRWFVRAPDYIRFEIGEHILKSVNDLYTKSSICISEGIPRQHSGDGRQVPGNLFLLGGDPATPPPMDGMGSFREEKKPDNISEEILRALDCFIRLGRLDDVIGSAAPPDHLFEASVEHFYVNDCIVSVRTLVDKEDDSDNDVFTTSSEVANSPPVENFAETRRRHQSAIQERRATRGHAESLSQKPKALDDLYAFGGPHQQGRRKEKVRSTTFIHLNVRHMYGRTSWLMRTFEEWPEDFLLSPSFPWLVVNLLNHLLPSNGITRLAKKDEDVERSIRVLDTHPGVELHAVGVLFIAPLQETEVEILSNTYGSDRYARFVKLLGEPITLDERPGGLESPLHGSYTYEHRDELSRIIFLISTLMPNQPNDPNCNSKKKLIANNFVSVIFNESGKTYKLGTVCGQFASVCIEVVPSDSKSLLITVHAKQDISCWLAMKRVLLSDASAARLLRKLIVRSLLSVNVARHGEESYISAGVNRLRNIRQIKERYKPKSKNFV
ncbi:unnamed protein product [Auanema sp. JU1783]|nr:unnamed protein product [Auanema sp. JU1783]